MNQSIPRTHLASENMGRSRSPGQTGLSLSSLLWRMHENTNHFQWVSVGHSLLAPKVIARPSGCGVFANNFWKQDRLVH